MIIDASVASKWILKGEKYERQAIELLKKHSVGTEKIAVPDLFFYEIANTLATKSGLSQRKVTDSLKVIFKANLEIFRPNPEEILLSAKLSKKYSTSVYDMLYAVVAKQNKAILFTADETFIKKTGFKFVKHIKDF